MLTYRLALLSLSSILISQADSVDRYRIKFKLGVRDLPSFDTDWSQVDWYYPGDLSDIYLRVYFGGKMIGQTQIKRDIVNHTFDEKFEINYDGNGKDLLVVQVFDDDTRGGWPRYDVDHFIGNVYIKLSNIVTIGEKEFPIVDGADIHGKVVVNTYNVVPY